jgi:hypothetical protein
LSYLSGHGPGVLQPVDRPFHDITRFGAIGIEADGPSSGRAAAQVGLLDAAWGTVASVSGMAAVVSLLVARLRTLSR